MKKGFPVDRYVPVSALSLLREATEKGECPADFQKLETAVLAFLRKASPADFAGVPDVTEGIENRILTRCAPPTACRRCLTMRKPSAIPTRESAGLCFAPFRCDQKMQEEGVPYLRVLGANERGLKLLKRAEETAKSRFYCVRPTRALSRRRDRRCSISPVRQLTFTTWRCPKRAPAARK